MGEATTSTARTNLLGLTRAGLEAFVVGMGEKPFRARQLFKWMYKRAVGDIDAMTDLGKDFRRRVGEIAEIHTPGIHLSQVSADGRIAIANRLVGAPLDTAEQAVETLLSSEDPWLRSSAIYAVGALHALRRQRAGLGRP